MIAYFHFGVPQTDKESIFPCTGAEQNARHAHDQHEQILDSVGNVFNEKTD